MLLAHRTDGSSQPQDGDNSICAVAMTVGSWAPPASSTEDIPPSWAQCSPLTGTF